MEIISKEFKNFWKNKNVIVTGCNGFKGTWLTLALIKFGANVSGIGLKNKKKHNLFNKLNLKKKIDFRHLDIRDKNSLGRYLKEKKKFNYIFHLAAQAIVIEGYNNPYKTFQTNSFGTLNLLDEISKINKKKIIINVTTDKVYLNKDKKNKMFKESDVLGGEDPYSASKVCAEIIAKCYQTSFFKKKGILISTVRAGNVIGGGDWSDKRLVPDLVKAWENNKNLLLRNPNYTRPWQHVLDPIFGYLYLSYKLSKNQKFVGEYNFGSDTKFNANVLFVTNELKKYFKDLKIRVKKQGKIYKEHQFLNLSSAKSKKNLGFNSKFNLKKTLELTAIWYQNYYKKMNIHEICDNDLKEYYGE